MSWSTKKIVITILISGFVLFVGFIASILFFVIGTLKNTTPYQMSVSLIEQSSVVEEKLGRIVDYGWFPVGSVNVSNDEGNANLSIPVHGEQSKGTVKTFFYRTRGQWILSEAQLFVADDVDGIPLTSLEITSITFHNQSATGPINEERIYEQGDTIYWAVIVEKFHTLNKKCSLKEGLTILNDKEEVIFEEPDLVTIEEEVASTSIHFDNYFYAPKTGTFTIKMKIADRFSDRIVEETVTATVKGAQNIKITNFNYRNDSGEGSMNEKALYKKGETVYVNFDLYGYKFDNDRISMAEDLYVFDTAGNLILNKPEILVIDEAWNKDEDLYLNNSINVPENGIYDLRIVIRDRHANQEVTHLSRFTVE